MVVICFQISIFEPLGTITLRNAAIVTELWFAFKLVSLNHWEQCRKTTSPRLTVVICFQISIFEPLGTIPAALSSPNRLLWFAFKLVSLNHWEQSFGTHYCRALVVICFQISIFEPLGTIHIIIYLCDDSCDLLSN